MKNVMLTTLPPDDGILLLLGCWRVVLLLKWRLEWWQVWFSFFSSDHHHEDDEEEAWWRKLLPLPLRLTMKKILHDFAPLSWFHWLLLLCLTRNANSGELHSNLSLVLLQERLSRCLPLSSYSFCFLLLLFDFLVPPLLVRCDRFHPFVDRVLLLLLRGLLHSLLEMTLSSLMKESMVMTILLTEKEGLILHSSFSSWG